MIDLDILFYFNRLLYPRWPTFNKKIQKSEESGMKVGKKLQNSIFHFSKSQNNHECL